MEYPNKTSSCNEKSITVYFTDARNHFTIPYESSHIQDLQLHGTNFQGETYQDKTPSIVFESDIFSPYQNRLYKEALHGLGSYEEEELAAMTFKQKLRIENLHKRAQRVLNIWKQSIISNQIDNLLLSLFYKSKFLRDNIVERTKNYTNNSITNYQSFAELRITKLDIAHKLVQEGILPRLFFNQKQPFNEV